jgi:hypothetical protein
MICLKLWENSEKINVTLELGVILLNWSKMSFFNIVLSEGDQNRIEVWSDSCTGTQVVQLVYLKGYRAFSRTETSIVLVPREKGVGYTTINLVDSN